MVSIAPDRTLAQQLGGTFALFGLIVAAGFVVQSLAYGISHVWLTPEFERSRLAVGAEGDAFAAMVDEENGLRAYLLTRDVRFIEPYTRGETQLARANTVLVANAGSVSEVAAAMLATRITEEAWRDRWAKPASDTRAEAALPSMLEGKSLFDLYRRERTPLAEGLNLRSERLAAREEVVSQARAALSLGVFVAVLFVAVRQHRKLRATIVDPVAALLRDIGRIRDGALEVTVDHGGARELRRLGEGLNEMVHALSAARGTAESRDEMLRRHSVRLRQILDASREFSESLNLKYVVNAVCTSTAAVGGYDKVIVWLMDDELKRLVDAEAPQVPEPSEDPRVGQGHDVASRAAKSGRVTFEDAAGQVRFNDSNVGPVRAIAIPLVVGARVVGAVEARDAEPRAATTQMIEILEMLAMHAATAIESARLHELTEERSHMDELTKLFNRRRLEEDLDAECKRSARYGRPLAFIMLDVDHFKAFNDSHGHPKADGALQEVAEVIARSVRTTDSAYRYGGEEFCILLRETTGLDAMILAERVRCRIERRFSTGPLAGITASLGVAEFYGASPLPRSLVEAADAAMYESKNTGRNRVVLSSPPVAPLGMTQGELEPALS
ncbi:MAG: diguanylate cyclase [Myxococcota bacterium]|nr:diguanylate cyclase [Myxococcota bacterium]